MEQQTPQTAVRTEPRAGEALSVRRLFTQAGVHPFETVEWETRDARIGTVFEQKDVEFPKTWSQNATNIVAQKYFRGQLDSPARERSVKQMVGRVSGTIADWGRQRGYFASVEDGDTFEAELTHILLNQLAAFNSPVWFNVGFEEQPQCSACLPFHALISTPDGMVPIGELVEGEQVGRDVYDADGVTRVVAVKHNGVKPVWRVRLRNGSFVEATADHVVKAVAERRTAPAWLRVDELKVGMRMHLHPHRAKSAAPALVPAGGGWGDDVADSSVDPIAVAEAALAGWLQADGFVGQYRDGTNRSLTIEFQTSGDDERRWVLDNLDLVLPGVHRHIRAADTVEIPVERIRLYGESLRDFVERWGLLARGTAIRVPARLWTASHDEIAAYLRSIFQADGYVSLRRDRGCENARVGFAVIGERWTEDVQVLLGVLGIYSRRIHKHEPRADRHDLHEVAISIGSERARFAELVGFVSERKQRKLLESLSLRNPKRCPDLREEEIVAIEPLGECDVYDIQTESGEFLTNNVAVHNCFILSVDDTMESILDWNTKEGTIFRGGSGSGINLSNIRGSMEPLSKGGTASGPVSFMRGADAWAGTIKSGGKCFKEGTLVATPSGLQPIERLRIGDEVLTHKGPRAVADFMPNGRRQCFRVLTREGYEVEVTSGHKFAYWNDLDGGFDVKPIETFRPGDSLYALLEPSTGGVSIPLLSPEIADPANATTTVEMQLPTELDERLAYVLGLTYGDGELRTTYPYRLRVSFRKDEAGCVSATRFRDYCRSVFGEEPLRLGDAAGHEQLGFTRKRLVEFLVANGIAKGKADALGFPALLFRAEPAVRAAFIAGVVDADGTYQRRGGWSISSIDRAFLVNVQRLLLTLGVPSKIKLSREERGMWRPLYRLHIVGHTFVERLVEHIAPHSAKAEVVYQPSPGADKGWGYRPSLFEPLTARVRERGGYRLVERSVGMNETSGYRAVATLASHPEAAVADYAQEASTCVQLTLESVTPTELAETYDVEVEDVHLLSANGIYSSNTRRAAKMVVLDVDHPDIREFIWCKAKEEDKAAALRDAGFDMSIDGDGFQSIQYQNANNSVRLTDEFMHAVEHDLEWSLIARATGQPTDTMPARELMREIAEAAWRCADPGVQYDTTINQWHTSPNSGRINASNPCCFAGDTLVRTSEGLLPIAELARRSAEGSELPHVDCMTLPDHRPTTARIMRAWSAGLASELSQVVLSDGQSFTCTPEHRFHTDDGRWFPARDLEGRTIAAVARDDGGATIALTRTATQVASVLSLTPDRPVEVFDIEVEGHHNFVIASEDSDDGPVVHNSEYMHVDDSACNLASLNLMKFRRPDGTLDVERFNHTVDIMLLAQEIVVGPSSYPTEEIGRNARAFRQLGLGYANLGAYLMSNGLAYDSDGGRGFAASITALMTGRAYLQSAKIAAAIGPHDRYAENREAHNNVMRMHRDASYAIPDASCDDETLLAASRETWNEAVALGELYGYRNAQASVLAPTGTISFLMDCDTTGVEPDFSLVKYKELVGGGTMTIVNRTVPMALRTLGYSDEQVEQIEAHVDEHGTIVGAPGLAEEHQPVFDVAVGARAIAHMGHIKMMGAVQPFISGALSKTINMPQTATVEDIADAYLQAWRLGIKALAIYRDGSKTAQALRTDAQDEQPVVVQGFSEEEVEALVAARVEEAVNAAVAAVRADTGPARKRMPRERESITHKFSLGGHEGYITAGKYEDGTVGEIFLTDIGKEGSTLRGMMNSFATAISIALQYGVPLETLVRKFAYMRFEPEGITTNPEIPFAKSMPDYIMRWLASRFLDADVQEDLGILTPAVRAKRTGEDISAATPGGTNGALKGNGKTGAPAATHQAEQPTAGAQGALPASPVQPPAAALTDTPPVHPARMVGLDLGPACAQCGGMMQRTGSCYTCSSCGSTTGCG